MAKKTVTDENGHKYTVKEKKPFYKKWWFWVIIVLVLIGIFASCSAGGGSDDSSSNSSSAKTEKKSDNNKASSTSANKTETNTAKAVTLGAGEYTVGDQIQPGRYIIKSLNGSGNLTSENAKEDDINIILGQQPDNESGQVDSFTTNLTKGEKIKIDGINQTSFTPVTTRQYLTQLTAGQWVVGKDIKPGRYKITATAGSGNFTSDNGDINEVLGTTADKDAGQVTSITEDLHKGEIINSNLQGVSLKAE